MGELVMYLSTKSCRSFKIIPKINYCDIINTSEVDWESCKTINEAIEILRIQFPPIVGFHDICKSGQGNHFIPLEPEFIHVVKYAERYVLFSTINEKKGDIIVFDPMANDLDSGLQELVSKFMQRHCSRAGLHIKYITFEHNIAKKYSGLLCIALAVYLCIMRSNSLDVVKNVRFDNFEQLLSSLTISLKSREFTRWWQNSLFSNCKKFSVLPPIEKTAKYEAGPLTISKVDVTLHCLCYRRQDVLMYKCRRCKMLYHIACVEKFGKISLDTDDQLLACPLCPNGRDLLYRVPITDSREKYTYVSYTCADFGPFVKRYLMRILEGNLDRSKHNDVYRLIVRDRDFTPGAIFFDEMYRNINKCSKFIVVLSLKYFQSHITAREWQALAYDNWNNIILILIDPPNKISDKCQNSCMKNFLEKRFNYVFHWYDQCARSDSYSNEFWNQVRNYLD